MELTKTGFKQTEVGSIPEDWKVVVLSEVTDLITDGAHLSPPSSIYGYPIATVENINKGYIDIESCRIISKKDYEYLVRNNCKPVKGDVLLSKDGTIGITFTLKDNHELVLLSSIALIRPNDNQLDSNYLSYSFKSEWFYTFLNRVKGGSALKRIVLRDINKFIFPLPPTLTEQKAIATALSDVDALISSLDKLITKKKAIKQGAMQELLTPPHKGGRRLPGFSGDWERVKVEKVIDVARGGSPRPIQDFITTLPNGINWIKIGDTSPKSKYIVSSVEKIIPEGSQFSRKVNKGDFLLSNSMSFGRPYILKIDGCIHDGWLVLQNYFESFDTEFLYYTLMSRDVFNQYIMKASGSSVLNLNKEIVKTVELNRPIDIKEQKAIAQILSDMDLEIESMENKKAKYQDIKQGMMQELLTGKTRLI